jgi:hypothetical protein
LLDGPGERLGILRDLLNARQEAYGAAADLRVDTDDLTPAEVVAEIERQLDGDAVAG